MGQSECSLAPPTRQRKSKQIKRESGAMRQDILWFKGRILENPVVGFIALPKQCKAPSSLQSNLSGGELGDSLGSLRNGVLGQFSGEHQTDGRLDLT